MAVSNQRSASAQLLTVGDYPSYELYSDELRKSMTTTGDSQGSRKALRLVLGKDRAIRHVHHC